MGVNVAKPGISDVSVIHAGSRDASKVIVTLPRGVDYVLGSHLFERVKADGVYSPGSSSSKLSVDCRTMR